MIIHLLLIIDESGLGKTAYICIFIDDSFVVNHLISIWY